MEGKSFFKISLCFPCFEVGICSKLNFILYVFRIRINKKLSNEESKLYEFCYSFIDVKYHAGGWKYLPSTWIILETFCSPWRKLSELVLSYKLWCLINCVLLCFLHLSCDQVSFYVVFLFCFQVIISSGVQLGLTTSTSPQAPSPANHVLTIRPKTSAIWGKYSSIYQSLNLFDTILPASWKSPVANIRTRNEFEVDEWRSRR